MATKEASVVVVTEMVENPPPEPVTIDIADDKPAAKAGKAKEPRAKKAPILRKPRSAPVHPPYEEMVKDVIVMLKEMIGSSQYTIIKFIEEKHKQLPPNFKKFLLFHLKKLISYNKIVKVKNSFKLPPVKSSAPKPASPVKKKPMTAAKLKAKVVAVKPKGGKKPATKAPAKPKAAAAKLKAKLKAKLVVKPKATALTPKATAPTKFKPAAKPKAHAAKPKDVATKPKVAAPKPKPIGFMVEPQLLHGIRVGYPTCEAKRPHVFHVTICAIHMLSLKIHHTREGVLRMNPTLMRGKTLHGLLSKLGYSPYCQLVLRGVAEPLISPCKVPSSINVRLILNSLGPAYALGSWPPPRLIPKRLKIKKECLDLLRRLPRLPRRSPNPPRPT